MLVTMLLAACSQPAIERPNIAPVVPGLLDTGLSANQRGRVLLGELGCSNCHDAGSVQIANRVGPNLATVGERLQASYLTTYLLSPLATEPGTCMPDVLRSLDGNELHSAANELSHYLRSFAKSTSQPSAIDADAAERGSNLYDTIGCNACHFPTIASRHLQTRKYTVASLQEFLLAPHEARPAARMPQMALSPAEAFELANYLLADYSTTLPTPSNTAANAATVDATLVAAGRTRFAAMGCNHCHALPDAQRETNAKAKPLQELTATAGCLSGNVGPWPHYALDAQQVADVRTALQELQQPLEPEQHAQLLLASRNCYACHRRDPVDAVTKHEDDFKTLDASIGQDGRLPPTLTGIGGKLQPAWLRNSIAHGQAERPYLKTRMPGFGDAFSEQLTELLIRCDQPPAHAIAPLPEDRKAAEVITKLGRDLVGEKGMNCITCHVFAGEQAGAMGAIDLVHSTGERLRPEWFAGFLRDPYRYKPTTLMPQFFPDGKSTRPEFVDGDTKQQIEAMWHYLAEGRNVRQPDGISHPPIELVVAEQAVMLRRSVQNTGKRGISVGYPGGVNITFDAENLGLNQIWWGRFVDARPVWTGQGSGQATILSRDRVTLPNGCALASIAPEQAWPTATRREQGDRFLGYDLDAQLRPTFRYTSGTTTIADTPHEVRNNAGTSLRRTFKLTGKSDVLFLLAARDQDIAAINDRVYRVGKSLHIDVGDELASLLQVGNQKELRILANLGGGTCELTIEYSWHAEGK